MPILAVSQFSVLNVNPGFAPQERIVLLGDAYFYRNEVFRYGRMLSAIAIKSDARNLVIAYRSHF
jgi:hypothetical protein